MSAAHFIEAVERAATLLHECRWPSTAPICEFHIGHPGDDCQRCHASWREHYSDGDA